MDTSPGRTNTNNEKVLLHDDETFEIDGIKIGALSLSPAIHGHINGSYLIDDKYLFTRYIFWFGADGGLQLHFLWQKGQTGQKVAGGAGAEAKAAMLFLTGYTRWTDNFEFAFAHKDSFADLFRKRVPTTAPY